MSRKQSQQESAAQPQQYHQAQLHQWKRPNWIQSAVQQLKNSAMQWFNLAVQPKYQFVVIGVLHFLGSQFNIFEQFITAVATSSASFQAVVHKVLTVQGCLLLWSGGQLLHRIRKEWAKTAINHQVVASRANMDEWRQCLQFGSEWHQTTLQGAYSLWQSQSLSVPSPPASQWMKLESGQPMLPSDAHLAGQTITEVKLAQFGVEARLAEYHELAVHHEAGVRQYSGHQLQLIQEVDGWYLQFEDTYQQFANSSLCEQWATLQHLASELDRVDKEW